MAAFHQHWNITPLHVDVQCRRQDKFLQLSKKIEIQIFHCHIWIQGKSILQVPDTGTRVLDNTRPFLHSSIVSFWITLACSKERKYHIFGQYRYTKNVPVLINTGTFQYLGPEVYFFRIQYKKCIQIITNKPSIGPVVLEIAPKNQRKCMKF